MIERKPFIAAAALLLLVHAVLLVASSWNKSPTYDEPEHLKFGLVYLERGTLPEADAQRMPVTLLNGLAFAPGGIDVDEIQTDRRRLLMARLPTMAVSLLLGLGLLLWSAGRFGRSGGLLTLALYCLCPTVLAHARLVTNDLYTAMAVAAAVYTFWTLCRRPSVRWLILSAATLGLAQGCKFSAMMLLPAFGAVLIVSARARAPLAAWLRERPARWGLLALYPVGAFLALGALYRFDGMFLAQADFEYHSYTLAWLKARLPWLRLPLPRVYLEGLDLSRYISTHPEVIRGHNYLFGRLNDDGWWYYYLAVGLLKMPLAVLAILGLRVFRRLRDGLTPFLLAPALALFLFFSFLSSVQLGIRYLLPVLPLLYIWAGSLLDSRQSHLPRIRMATALLLLAAAISSLLAYPDYISYTGELAGPRIHAWRLMADSNLDWGQDRWHLSEYRRQHPEAIVNPEGPTAGHLVVRVNLVTGVFHAERYRWLREHFEPEETIRGSYLVYRIDEADLAAVQSGAPPREGP